MTSKKGIVACVSDDLTEFEKKQIHPELLKPDLSVHLLPCAIDHKGPAAVSQYFHPTIEDFGDNHLKAKFRGRSLEGSVVKLPKGYEGGVMVEMRKKLTSEDIEEPKQLKIVGTFDQLHCWNLDRKPSANDPFPRALQWLELAEALHGTTE